MFNNNSIDTIELNEENLNAARTGYICQQILNTSEKIWCISFRNCSIHDSDFEKLIRAIKKCKIVRYLNFNINFINSFDRVSYLTTLLPSLTYLDTLCLHSSNLRDDGLKILSYSLMNHKHFRSLDIGDCQLSDQCVPYVREILHRREHDKGLYELVISSNPNITPVGWSKILVAVAASSDLKYYHMDYNNLDDSCGYLIIAILSSNQSLEVLDLESTGLGNKTAQLLVYMLKSYAFYIKSIFLNNNPIDPSIIKEINNFVITEYETDESSNKKYIKPERKQKTIPTNTISNEEIRIRDQLRLQQIVNNANKYNNQRINGLNTSTEYEISLEREYNNLNKRTKNYTRKSSTQIINDHRKSNNRIDSDEGEHLEPFDDFRFKSHSILPLNFKH